MRLSMAILYLNILVGSQCNSDQRPTGVSVFLHEIGWKHVSLVWHRGNASTVMAFLKSSSMTGVSVAVRHQLTDNVALPLITDDWNTFLSTLTSTKSQQYDVMMVIFGSMDKFIRRLELVKSSKSFFVAHVEEEAAVSVNWGLVYHGQTFKRERKVVLNQWWNDGHSALETYDMQGAEVWTVSLSYKPWVEVTGCVEEGYKNCQSSGITSDMINELSKMFNFTWRVDKSDPPVWGSVPEVVLHDNGSTAYHYEGVLGLVMSGEYDLSTSQWLSNSRRHPFLDFAYPAHFLNLRVVINHSKDIMDMTLFVRPFTVTSWLCITAFVITITGASKLVGGLSEADDGKRLVLFSSWTFFVLINTFYNGAMTMFFSSGASDPFSTLSEGLRQYPTWTLIINRGDMEEILFRAELGEVGYEQWAEKAETKGFILDDDHAVLDRLLTPGHFTLMESQRLAAAAAELHSQHELKEIGDSLVRQFALVLPKHSPYTKMVNVGTVRLLQTGVRDVILKNHQLKLPAVKEAATLALGWRQTGLIFIAYVALVGCTFLILCAELGATFIGGQVTTC